MHCNFLALWQKLSVYTWFWRKPIFFCWISIILQTLHMISMHCNFLALGQKLTVCTWFCRKPIYFRGISIILQTLQLSWNRCPLYALGDPTQLNDSLQAFACCGRVWKIHRPMPWGQFFLICGKILPPYGIGMTFCQSAMSIFSQTLSIQWKNISFWWNCVPNVNFCKSITKLQCIN